VIESIILGAPGDVIITKMSAIKIVDLATVMVREYAPLCGRRSQDIEVQIVGQKPGEKLYEELMNEEETRRSFELDRHFVIRPALAAVSKASLTGYGGEQKPVKIPYNSANVTPLSQDRVAEFLYKHDLLNSGSPAGSC
jgi:FlaA1/EpsC-like NDP-sugar epimerase